MSNIIITNDRIDYSHIAQPGEVCQICYTTFWPGEVVTAVTSGGVTGLHCGDVEGCLERRHCDWANSRDEAARERGAARHPLTGGETEPTFFPSPPSESLD